MLTPARSQTLTENVIDQLLSMIRKGTWQPGESLPSEKQLMDRLGVGRSCLREALQSLATLGVIEIRAGRGARVTPPSVQSLIDPAGVGGLLILDNLVHLWEVRVAIEVSAIRITADRAEPEDLRRLEAAVKAMSECMDGSDLAGYVEYDMEFHQRLVDATHNPIFSQVFCLIRRLVGVWVSKSGRTPGGMARGLRWHRAILDAVRVGDPDAAEEAMRKHLGGPNKIRDALAGVPVSASDLEEPAPTH